MNIVNMEYLENRLLFANYPLIISSGYPVPSSLEISDDKKWADKSEEIAERKLGNNRGLMKKKEKWHYLDRTSNEKKALTDHQDTRIVHYTEEHLTSK